MVCLMKSLDDVALPRIFLPLNRQLTKNHIVERLLFGVRIIYLRTFIKLHKLNGLNLLSVW